MRQLTRLLALIGLVACAMHCDLSTGHADEPALSPDEQKLQGAWKEVWKKAYGSKTGQNPEPAYLEYTFEKHGCTEQLPEPNPALKPFPPVAYTFVIDEQTEPHRLDLLVKDGRGNGVFPGIYKWDGDRLVWCHSVRAYDNNDKRDAKRLAKVRPTKFESPDKSLLSLSILERMEAPAKSKEPEDKKSDEQKLQGAWKEVLKHATGPVTAEDPGAGFLNEYTFEKPDCVQSTPVPKAFPAQKPFPPRTYTFIVDEKTEPHRLDLLIKAGRGTDIYPGIYKWDGDHLVWRRTIRAELVGNDKKIAEARPTTFEPGDISVFCTAILVRVEAPAESKEPENKKPPEDLGSGKTDESK